MWLKTAIASAFLMLGASIAAAQTPNAAPPPRDLTFETRDLIFEVLDLELRIESMGVQSGKPPLPTPPAPVPAPKRPAPEPSAAPPPARSAPLGRRVALVIGNAGYKVGPLQNPGNDAAAVAEAFEKKLRFDKVILRQDLGFDGFRTALHQFAREATGADTAVVYFAGHGMEVNGRNFLIPVDAKLARAGDLELEAVALDTVLNQLAGVKTLKLVILDACRNNAFPVANAKRGSGRGLARIEPEGHAVVVYAAKHGTTAADGSGRHSPLAEAFLKHIDSGQEIRFLFGSVRDDVMAATGGAQEPHVYSNLGGGKIYLHR